MLLGLVREAARRKALDGLGARVAPVRGGWDERRRRAVEAIEALRAPGDARRAKR
jgi:hypothetical protein